MERQQLIFHRSMGRWLMMLLLLMLTSVAARAAEAYACYTPSNTTLTFYYDNLRSSRTGTTYNLTASTQTPPGWVNDSTNLSVTKVVFDSSFANYTPASNYRWFYNMSNLTTITNISNLNTQIVISMKEMFLGCSNLTSINLSGFNTANVLNMSYMFEGCSKLTSLDLSGFNTAKVQSMFRMFYGCTGLTSLNLSGFSNDNVTDMESMFYNCSALTNLNLCGFSTPSVTKMNSMFYGCSKLTSLDLSSFNTANVTDMFAMFYGCAKLVSLDLSRFNTANVTRMTNMFYLNVSLASIFVGSDWNTDAVTGSSNMFMRCDKLVGGQGTTYTSAHLDKSYAHIDGGPSNPGYFTDISDVYECFTLGGIFYRVTSESPNEVEVTYKNTNYNSYSGSVTIPSTVTQLGYTFSVTGIGEAAFAYSTGLTSVTIPSSVTSIGNGAFAYCSGLTSVTVPSSVTDMGDAPFGGCDGLTTLKVASGNPVYDSRGNCNAIIRKSDNALISGCKTTVIPNNVTSIESGAFVLLPSLTSIAIPSSVTSIGPIAFGGCTGLTSVTIPSSVTSIGNQAFAQCTGLTSVTCQAEIPPALADEDVFDVATYANATLTVPPGRVSAYQAANGWKNFAHIDAEPEAEPYACYTPSNTTLTFYYDNQRSIRPGTTYELNTGTVLPLWYSICTSVTDVVFNPSFAVARPTTTYSWFRDMSNLTTITGIENLNTSDVAYMDFMFYKCSGLTSLDLSGFNTAKVTSMLTMFYKCSGLTSLDLSNFNTSIVENMSEMFDGCSSLTSLDLSGFNTSNVTTMSSMFYGCSGLTSLDLSHFSTSNVTNMSNMFDGCNNLSSLDLSNFNTSNVTDMSFMFDGCSSLTSLGLSSFNTARVATMKSMFSSCSGLTSLDVSSFNTLNVTTMSSMFYGCSGLTSLDLSNFNTTNVTDISSMFYGCSGLTSLDVSSFNTSNVTMMAGMFDGCQHLTSLDVSSFNTSNVANMGFMFYQCSGLTSLDVSNFNTENVTSMASMFRLSEALTTVYVGDGWSTDAVTTSTNMFQGCTSLVGGKGTTYDANHVDAAYAHIDGGPSDPGYFTDINAPTEPEAYACYTPSNTTLTFYYDKLRSIREGTIFDINLGGNGMGMLPSWVLGTSSIEEYVKYVVFDPSFANANPTSICGWFGMMENLESITGMTQYLNTSRVTDMTYMFLDCKKLTNLDLSGFNTEKAKYMMGMFSGIGLTELDLSNFNTARVTITNSMFQNCDNLATIYVGEGWSTASVTNSLNMFDGCTSLVGGKGTTYDANHVDAAYAHIDGGPSDPGYFTDINAPAEPEAYAVYTADNTTLTFYYDTERSIREGTTYDMNVGMDDPGWDIDGNYSSVTHVVFDPSFADARPVSTCSWFWGMTNLQSITGMDCMNTEDVTTMWGMFNSCSSLTVLDLSSFNTSKVTNMLGMFSDCSNLTTIYAGEGWSMATVSVNSNMFTNCTRLVGGKGTTYDPNHTNGYYARIDGGPSNPGYFSEKQDFLLGDVNGDGYVRINDVTALIDYLLSGDGSGINVDAADCNHDNDVRINDVTALIDYLLSGSW